MKAKKSQIFSLSLHTNRVKIDLAYPQLAHLLQRLVSP
jgi:hypothetical protein